MARYRQMSLREWVDCTFEYAFVFFYAVVGALLAAMTFAFANIGYHDSHHDYEAQTRVVRMFDEVKGTAAEQVAERRDLARSIISIQQHHGNIPGADSKQLKPKIERIAHTGSRLDVNLVEPSRWRNAQFPLLIVGIIWAIIGSICTAVSYVHDCDLEKRNMALLPWHRSWPWLVVLLCSCHPFFIRWMILDYRHLRKQIKQPRDAVVG